MKKGWEYSKIGKLCKTYSGGTPLKNVKEYYQDGNIPWLRSGEVCKKYITETEMFITQKGLENSSAKYYPINTVVVAMYGATAAQVGILKIEATSNQAVCGIIPNSRFLPEFLYYFFSYRKEFLASQAQGGAQPNISQIKIKNLEVPIPPLSEQQSIVDYLDSAFAKIDAMKANAEKALDEAKALFQASLKEMLEPQKEWEEKKFGKICDFVRGPFGGSLKKECFKDSGYAVYEQQNAIYNKFTFRYFIDEEKYNSLIRFKVNSGDLIMSCSGTIGKVAIIPENFKEGIINQALLKLTPNKDVDAHFLKYLMESNYFKEIINANIEGVAIKNIASVAVLKEIKLYVPKVSEQQKIVIEIDSLKSKVDRLQENYEKISQECDALKQAILRQVFE